MNNLKTTNYAGRPVWHGLGFVWIGWAILMAFMGMWQLALATSAVFALGLLDDLFGSDEAKGFRGHLKALRSGRVTTGLVKLGGISLVSFLYAWYLREGFTPAWREALEGVTRIWTLDARAMHPLLAVGITLLAGAAIALTSNFLNLLDLRPGRAAKIYLVLVGIAVFVMVAAGYVAGSIFTSIMLFALPIATIIIPDLRERAMLGDAGANTAGFVAGALIVSLLPLWALIVYFLVMLALNLASERISFSRVIDNNPLLRKLDNIGRLKSGE